MGIFDFLKGRTTTNVRFEKDPPGEWITLETPEGVSDMVEQSDIIRCVSTMVENPDFYMILTLPNALHGIRYVQACECRGVIDVQLAVEKRDHVRLVERLCTPGECFDIFRKFYDTGEVDKRWKYRPVRFNRRMPSEAEIPKEQA